MDVGDVGLSPSERLSVVATLLARGVLRLGFPKVTGPERWEGEKPGNSPVPVHEGLAVSSSSSPDASVGSRA